MITSFGVLHWIKNLDFVFQQMNSKLVVNGEILHLMLSYKNFNLRKLEHIINISKEKNLKKIQSQILSLNKKISRQTIMDYCLLHNFKILNLIKFKSFIKNNNSNCDLEYILLHAKKL